MLKIMVVDDSRLMHALYSSLLPEMELVHAHDGLDALGLLEHHPNIDLILLDMTMPNMDGLGFLDATRRDPGYAQIPTIMVTTESARGDVARALKAGASGYVGKPFRRAELIEVMESAIERRTTRAIESANNHQPV